MYMYVCMYEYVPVPLCYTLDMAWVPKWARGLLQQPEPIYEGIYVCMHACMYEHTYMYEYTNMYVYFVLCNWYPYT